MFEKSGKFYADWRDTSGNRLRKSFATKRAALQYEAEQKELAHPKSPAQGLQRPKSFAPRSSAPKPTPTKTAHKPANSSSRKLVTFRPRS
jgi:hypothetical protein